MRMMAGEVSPGPDGFEQQTYKCLRCSCTAAKLVACDLLKSDAVGWLSGELGNSASEHEIKEGQMLPKSKQ
jgi:hypothetical protein